MLNFPYELLAAQLRCVHYQKVHLDPSQILYHGNSLCIPNLGFSHIFLNDSYPSQLHQFGFFYPGSGNYDEIGTGKGSGKIINFPMRAGTGDDVIPIYFEEIIAPIYTVISISNSGILISPASL